MSLIGNNWKEDSTSSERFEEISGYPCYGDIPKEINKKLDCPYTSKTERKKLIDLLNDIENYEK